MFNAEDLHVILIKSLFSWVIKNEYAALFGGDISNIPRHFRIKVSSQKSTVEEVLNRKEFCAPKFVQIPNCLNQNLLSKGCWTKYYQKYLFEKWFLKNIFSSK